MEFFEIGLLQREALAFLGDDMHHAGSFDALGRFERIDHRRNVVAVDGPEIPEAQLLEQHARRPEILDAFFDVLGEVYHPLPTDEFRRSVDDTLRYLTKLVRHQGGVNGTEVLADRAHVGRYGHAVVVHDHDDVTVGMPCIVHSFIGHAACESAISHHSNHVMRLAFQIPCRRHAESGGHGSTGMTGAELIMLALVAAEKS